MADHGTPVSPQTPGGMEIPSLKAPDYQILMQDLAQSRRDLSEERRNSEKKILYEQERSRWERERLQKERQAEVDALRHENTALARMIGRITADNDRLREEVAVLKFSVAPHNHVAEEPGKEEGQPSKPAASPEIKVIQPPDPVSGKPIALSKI